MSVLIPGMEMPTSCGDCIFCTEGCVSTYCAATHEDYEDERFPCHSVPDWCPLVPVPEHGPLVDALDIINTFPDDYVFTNEQARALTNYIIPADPAEEGEG